MHNAEVTSARRWSWRLVGEAQKKEQIGEIDDKRDRWFISVKKKKQKKNARIVLGSASCCKSMSSEPQGNWSSQRKCTGRRPQQEAFIWLGHASKAVQNLGQTPVRLIDGSGDEEEAGMVV